ncbi:MAG TPA: tetratricopeptide repeat protein, partial [Puia sp.]|nr:tetratricopeptide repeat protein [Puia sp.]
AVLSALSTLTAQEPDWNRYPNVKEQLTAITQFGRDLIKHQQYTKAIPLLLKGVNISKAASLDSFTAANNYLLGLDYRINARYDSAFYYLRSAEKIAREKGYTVILAAVQIEYYAVFNRKGQADSATAVIGRLKDLLPRLDSNSSESGKIEMYLGHNEKHKAKYAEAIGHYHRALRTFLFLKDSVDEGNIYISLANAMSGLGQNEKCLEYHRQAAALFTQMNRPAELVNELVNIADQYYTTGQLDSAESAAKRALPIAQKIKEPTYEAYALLSLGNIYKRRRKFPEAEQYLSEVLRISEQMGNTNALSGAYRGLAEMYITEKRPEKAKPLLEKELLLSQQKNDKEEITGTYYDMADVEYALHDYKKAYDYQKQFGIYEDSIFSETALRSSAEMEAKYQGEKKEHEIVLLKKDQQLANLSLQRQKNLQVAGVIFFVLLVSIGLLVLNRYRILHRSRRIIEMERMRNSIARDLHDDIGSTLTSINILSKVSLQQETNSADLMAANMQKIKDRSSSIMESMGDLVWAINPQNDNVEQMVSRMKEFAAEILEPLDINYTFNREGDFSAIKLDVKKRKDLYLLFKEAVNNAAKYSRCSSLVIELRQHLHVLQLKVTDNGTGFDKLGVRNGNGLRNMRERAVSLQSDGLRIDSVIGEGTSVEVEVPIT